MYPSIDLYDASVASHPIAIGCDATKINSNNEAWHKKMFHAGQRREKEETRASKNPVNP